jgi:hypothetical protein
MLVAASPHPHKDYWAISANDDSVAMFLIIGMLNLLGRIHRFATLMLVNVTLNTGA